MIIIVSPQRSGPELLPPAHHPEGDRLEPLEAVVDGEHRLRRHRVFDLLKVLLEVRPRPNLVQGQITNQIRVIATF